MELKEKFEELGTAFNEFKKANDARVAAIEKKGYAPAELEEKTNKLNDKLTEIEQSIKAVQTAMNRTAKDGGGDVDKDEALKKHAEMISKYMRKGFVSEELKAMSVDSDQDGGYLVTPQMSSEVVKKVYESSPMREISSVMTIGTDALEIIEDLDEAASGWVGEQQARPETGTPKIQKIVIPVHELYAQPKATQKLLDDAAINIEAWLAGKVSEKFGRDEASAFVAGNGVTRPRGFLTYANGTAFGEIEQTESASSGVIVGDDLINTNYSLKGEYKKNGKWLAQRQTIKVFRKLKDLEGRYLWEPGLNGDAQATILGAPVLEANDMQAYAGGNLAVAFGDFKAGYQIVDRIGIRVLRDPYSAKPYILFYTTKRVGGAVKNFEAIKLLKVKS